MAKKAINSVYEACGLLREGINNSDDEETVRKKIKKNLSSIRKSFQRCINDLNSRLIKKLRDRLGKQPSDYEIIDERKKPQWVWIERYNDSLVKLQDAYELLTNKVNDAEQESSNCNVCGELPQETLKVKDANGKIVDLEKNLWNGKIFCYKCFLKEYGKDNDISGLPQPNSNPPPSPENSESCILCRTFDNLYNYEGIIICVTCICKRLKSGACTSLEEMDGWDLLTSEEKDKFINKINSLPASFSSKDEFYKLRNTITNIKHEVASFIQTKTERDLSIDQKRTNFIQKLKTLDGWNLLTAEEKQNFLNQVNDSPVEQFKNIYKQAKKLIKEKQKQTGGEGGNNSGNHNHLGDNSDSDSGYDSDDDQLLVNLQELAKSQTQTEQKIEKLLKENGISEQELNQESLLGGTDWKSYLKKLDTPQKVAEFMEKMQQSIAALKAKKLAESSSNKDQDPSNDKILPIVILIVSFLALTSLILIVRKRRRGRF